MLPRRKRRSVERFKAKLRSPPKRAKLLWCTFTRTLLSLLFKHFDVNSEVLQSGRNVRTQLTNFSHTKNCWDLRARALSRYLLSKEVSASHRHLPQARPYSRGRVSCRGLSLIISATRDWMGLAPWSEVQSLCERNNTRGNCLHSELLSNYTVFCGQRSHEVNLCVMGRNDLTVAMFDSTE